MTDCCGQTSAANLLQAETILTRGDHWDHLLARLGIRRSQHRVAPGLYAVGRPGPDSPVLVTANYTLSFDAVRANLTGIDAYLLVLDTRGVNVWCAAGKGTFGTGELLRRLREAGLSDLVRHRRLILPQLGAPGIEAHTVRRESGFTVEYGPVRAADLPEYLRTREATPEMRRVKFGLWDRLVLIPVEFNHLLLPMGIAGALLLLLGGVLPAAAIIVSMLGGVVLFPILLPWLLLRDFSARGFLLGGLVAAPFAWLAVSAQPDAAWWFRGALALATMLGLPAVTAFLALNFTGSTTFTSPTGVRREIARYTRPMVGLFGAGLVIALAMRIVHWLGGA